MLFRTRRKWPEIVPAVGPGLVLDPHPCSWVGPS
nr:MAG TPA: hypothetical protein [Caudoviricetes sp.]